MLSDPAPGYYDDNASSLAATYESLDAARLNAWFKDYLPAAPGCVLDIGAGSGRDAAWLAARGFDVVAVEPSAAMVREAQRRHAEPRIHWIAGDALPGLERTLRRGLAFDFILLSAVWMHVPPTQRRRALRKVLALLKPGARLALTLRHGPAPVGQGVHETHAPEIEALCRDLGAYVEVRHDDVPDLAGRAGVTWTQLLIRLPDDGTGALPLLRQIILNDRKETTYKLALLRVLCRVAENAAGLVRAQGDDQVAVPLGLVGLYWLRLYKPLLQGGFAQSADNIGLEQLGFVKAGFRALQGTSHRDLRIGRGGFADPEATALHAALDDAIKTLVKMPIRHTTLADGTPVFAAMPRRKPARPTALRLDEPYLSSFGELLVPATLWTALQRHTAWVEPAILAEWVALMQRFAQGQGRMLDLAALAQAMDWPDPQRDVRVARERALSLVQTATLHCVWSDKRLTAANLAVDHCLPFAVWPCDDLWNLLPVDASVNGRKRDRVPSTQALRTRQEAILAWWQQGYCAPQVPLLRERFASEACASLPSLAADAVTPEEVFSGLLLQQLRLRHDQQAPVWEP